MLEVMEFIFSSFWVWLGTVILIAVVGESLSSLISVSIKRVTGRKEK